MNSSGHAFAQLPGVAESGERTHHEIRKVA
jgi:hypothetical protein